LGVCGELSRFVQVTVKPSILTDVGMLYVEMYAMKENPRKSGEPASADELIWGIHPVFEFLRNKPQLIREVIVQKGRAGSRVQELIELARKQGVRLRFDPIFKLPPAVRSQSHQGVIAYLSTRAILSLEELLGKLRQRKAPILLATDTIQDPHNLGAIIRSASAAGAAGVIITRDRAAPLTGTVEKAAAGALAHMDICQVVNLAVTLEKLKEEGFWIYGAAGEAGLSIYGTDFSSGSICLVIGGEGKGIRPLVRTKCDLLLSIPMQSPLDSLNAAAAAAVILFEIVRQRQGK
jgi:23S rRNA (guanosine2251-2'-O)-methyltransferase